MPHIAFVDYYLRSHEDEDNIVFVSATETATSSPATTTTRTLSVDFTIEHQVCPENDPMKTIHSRFFRNFEETNVADDATSSFRRMLSSLHLPFRLGKKFEWEPEANDDSESEPLRDGLDDVAARLSKLGGGGGEVSVNMVMLTVLPPVVFEAVAWLFILHHPDATSADEMELETASYEGAEVMTCVICLDDVEVGSEIEDLECCHVFHGDCLREWMRRKRTCPICRLQLD